MKFLPSIVDVILLFVLAKLFTQFSPFVYDPAVSHNTAVYALLRVGSILFLLSIQLGIGSLSLSRFHKSLPSKKDGLNNLLVNFVCGAVILKASFFLLGRMDMLNLYVVSAIFTVSILAAQKYSISRNLFVFFYWAYGQCAPFRWITIAALFPFVTGFVCWVKLGLIPLDGDYLSHYSQFLIVSAREGGIRLNDVWYQYFYSKTDGLGIASIIFFDRNGKLDVSASYLIIAVICFYKLLELARISQSGRYFATALLPLTLMLSDAGSMAKHHIYVLASIILLVYFIVLFARSTFKEHRHKYTISLAASFFLCILSSTPSVLFCVVILFVFSCYLLKKRDYRDLRLTCLIGLAGAVLVLGLMADNYLSIGIAEGTPFRLFAALANYQMFSQHVSPYLLTYIEQGTAPSTGQIGFDALPLIYNIGNIFRLKEILAGTGIFVVLATIFGCLVPWKRSPEFAVSKNKNLIILLSLSVLVAAIAAFVAVRQPVSVIRATSFTTPFTVLLLILLIERLNDFSRQQFVYLQIILFASLSWGISANFPHSQFEAMYGRKSIDDIYADERIILPNTKISLDLRQKYGADIDILALNLIANEHGRGYLTGNGIKSEASYALTPDWHEMAFGEPDTAKNILGTVADIFLIHLQSPGIGLLPYSLLFSNESLTQNFVSISSNGWWRALVLKSSPLARHGKPLSPTDLATWQHSIDYSGFSRLADRVRIIYEYNQRIGTPSNSRPKIPDGLPDGHHWQ